MMTTFRLCSDHPLSKTIPGFVRGIGSYERYMNVAHNVESSLLSSALFLVSKEPITDDRIRAALSRLVVKIPNLNLRIVDHVTKPGNEAVSVFVERERIDIPLDTIDGTNWIAQLAKEWKTNYDLRKGPLWRVTHMPHAVTGRADQKFPHETTLIFSFLHTIIDGMSFQFLFGEFLNALETMKTGNPENLVPRKYSLTLEYYVPKISWWKNDLIDFSVTLFLKNRFGKRITKWLLDKSKSKYFSKFTLPIEEDHASPVEGGLVPLVFTQDETSAVTKTCKEKGVTVNGVALATAAIAFAQVLYGEILSQKSEEEIYCAVNLRRLRKELKKAYGMFATVVTVSPPIPKNAAFDPDAFWDTAKYCTETVHKMIQNEEYASMVNVLGAIVSLFESGSLKLEDMTTGGCGRDPVATVLTNMGRCDFLDCNSGSTVKLAARFGGESEHNIGVLLYNDLVTFNGRLFWSVAHSKHIVPTERAELYGKYIKQTLLRLTQTDTEL